MTGHVRLDGFTYETTRRAWDAKTRIPWLERDPDRADPSRPGPTQPYRQLARYFDAVGKTENAVIGVAAACVVGWVVYRRSQRMGIMAPSDKDAAKELQNTGKLPGHYPRFNLFIASLEYTFPLVKLGQADKWQPQPGDAPPLKGSLFRRLAQLIALRRSLRWIIWAQILLGWLLATLFVAAITGLVQHGT